MKDKNMDRGLSERKMNAVSEGTEEKVVVGRRERERIGVMKSR